MKQTPKQKFESELKQLLKKYGAELEAVDINKSTQEVSNPMIRLIIKGVGFSLGDWIA